MDKEEYLSIQELSKRIPFRVQSIRNMISKGIFRLGEHYVKPGGKGRPVFLWSKVEQWLRRGEQEQVVPLVRGG